MSVATGAVAFDDARFGAGTGIIYLGDVGCTGGETKLIDCSHSSTFNCSGRHSEGAGVRCQGLEKGSSVLSF